MKVRPNASRVQLAKSTTTGVRLRPVSHVRRGGYRTVARLVASAALWAHTQRRGRSSARPAPQGSTTMTATRRHVVACARQGLSAATPGQRLAPRARPVASPPAAPVTARPRGRRTSKSSALRSGRRAIGLTAARRRWRRHWLHQLCRKRVPNNFWRCWNVGIRNSVLTDKSPAIFMNLCFPLTNNF
jgi:hypothetical protein